MKVITVVGARPQFVKAAVISRAFKAYTQIDERIIHTGQHFEADMSNVFFEEMAIPKPAYYLDIHSLPHGAMTGRMTERIESVLLSEKPNAVLVYGDTDSTLAGALAAAKLQIPIAHVEAGLRSFDRTMPEEINRKLTDHLSRWLFCPTNAAVENLKGEGIGIAGDRLSAQVHHCGDVMQDAALFYGPRARAPQTDLPAAFLLCTMHRPANTDNPLRLMSVIEAMEAVSRQLPVVFPLHPRTRQKLQACHYNLSTSPIRFIEPVGYLEMVYLLKHCRLVATDSGGLQKEAYFFGKYGLTLRDRTEWTELVENGYSLLCDTDANRILSAFNALLERPPMDKNHALYGDGDAGETIVRRLQAEL